MHPPAPTASCPHFLPARLCTRPPAAMVKVAGNLGKSADVMKAVNGLIKVPELNRTMAEMSRGT